MGKIIWKTDPILEYSWFDPECPHVFPIFIDAGKDWSFYNT